MEELHTNKVINITKTIVIRVDSAADKKAPRLQFRYNIVSLTKFSNENYIKIASGFATSRH